MTTRSFLNFVSNGDPNLPIYALVDLDPDGLSILRCYQHGSESLSHESHANIPSMEWLGIKTGHIRQFDISQPREGPEGNESPTLHTSNPRSPVTSTGCKDAFRYLTVRDRELAARNLKKIVGVGQQREGDPATMETKGELQSMLMLGVKAEIEWLDESGDLFTWLDRELKNALNTERL